MRLTAEEARSLVVSVLTRHSLGRDDAAVVADSLVEAELRGRPTHGLLRVPGIIAMCANLPSRPPEVVCDRGASAAIDAYGHLGYVAGRLGADEALRRARRYGLALVAVRGCQHTGMVGYYVDLLARAGVIGLAFADCRPIVAPLGGAEAVLGTNPIAAAFPREPHPILVDCGTAAITFGEVRRRQAAGQSLPEGVALDRDGRPTTDPDATFDGALLPRAGVMGYAFGVMAQLFAGAATLAGGLPRRTDAYGLLLLAMRTDLFGEDAAYRREIDAFVDAVHGSRRAAGAERILLPGERAYAERARRLAEGIAVDDDLLACLRAW